MGNKALVQNVRKFLGDKSFFVNIGANDGISNDPVYPFIKRFSWEGIEVEPQPDVFDLLKKNLRAHKGIIFENVAISEEELVFYRISDDLTKLEPALSQISSFDKNHITYFLKLLSEGKIKNDMLLGNPLPPFEDMVKSIVSQKVTTMGFNALMEKHAVSKIDFLNIDVESRDYSVLSSIDFDRYAPKILCIETLGFSGEQRDSFLKLIEKQGYRFLQKFGLPSEVYVKA